MGPGHFLNRLELVEPVFSEEELITLQAVRSSPMWVKMRLLLEYRLLMALLDADRNDVTDDARKGYLWCVGEIDRLPEVPKEPIPDDMRPTSIQMEEDPDFDD